ncbi:hypothetical protein [Cellvibrio polysaccharolyticus]|uniref:Uncharacterized protein n=1 Tax=Cellvibrio polysaccharolyticus TaxID=2082724 RepID=A0A928YVJ4_9GAMM|nr:hypothetical protein [Cellvibrio polysaccharolyticus]MBE8719099.1 hypothetical protein [Cellvibrio polysaccharolyticus]
MQAHQYLAIGLRLLAIGIFIYSLKQLTTVLTILFMDGYEDMKASPFFFFALWAIPSLAAAILWFFPTQISKHVIPPDLDNTVLPEKTFSILVSLILTVGLIALFYALVDVVYWSIYLHLFFNNPGLYASAFDHQASIIATGFETVAALVILLRARTIAKFLYNVAR